jgi:HK97 family phage major capsid protein
MKLTRKHLVFAILATLSVLAAFTLLGHPIIPPEALAGFGMLPLAAGPVSMDEVAHTLEQQGKLFKSFVDRNDAEKEELKAAISDLQKKAGRPGLGGSNALNLTNPEMKALTNAARALITGNQEKANEYFVEAKAMSAGSDPDGGYVVHDVISSGMTKVMAEISPIYRLARKIPMPKGGAFEEPIDKESAEAAWVGELQARPDTATPGLGMFRVELNEIYAMPKASQKVIDIASANVIGWLQEKVGDAFGVKEGVAYHVGDGVVKPRGILTYPTAATVDVLRAWGTFEHIATGVNGGFPVSSTTVNPADKLVDVTTALKPQYRNGAVWLMNRLTAGVVRKLKDAEGRHVWVDSLIQGQPAVLLGYPVEIDEEMPDLATGSLSIAFGNVEKTYTIIEQPGTKFLTDPYTDKPNVRLFAYRRVGGGANNSEAMKFLKFS